MEITNKVKKTVILGINGSGKTYFTKKNYLDKERYHFIVDPNREYSGGYNRYMPKITQDQKQLNAELELVIKRFVNHNAPMMESKRKVKHPLELFAIDEADLFAPSRQNLPYALHRLLVECRHRGNGLDLLFITRRPTDLNAKIMDLADEIIVFCQTGVNAIKRLDSLSQGLGQAAANLDYDLHEYLVVNRKREYTKVTP